MIKYIVRNNSIFIPFLSIWTISSSILGSINMQIFFRDSILAISIFLLFGVANIFTTLYLTWYSDIIATHTYSVTELVEAKLKGKEICPKCNKTILDEKTFWLSNCTDDFCALEGKPLIIRALLWHVWF